MKELLITFGVLLLLAIILVAVQEKPEAEAVKPESWGQESRSTGWEPVGIREDEFGRATVVYKKRGKHQQFSFEE